MAWQQPNLSVVGELPQGLPHLGFPSISLGEWKTLLPSSAVLALIAYLSSLSASEAIKENGQSSAKQNQELMALGAANIASALSQAFPTGGSFSRTLVNKAAGAKTQMASIFTVLLVGLFCVFANQVFKLLPQAVLGVIIVLAAWPLIRFENAVAAWRFQKSEGLVWLLSFVMVLVSGAEKGILLGMLLSLVLYLKRTSMPHIAEVGRVGNSDHFRNVLHYKTNTHPEILLIRIDENLYFANCQYLQDIIMQRLHARAGIKQVVLVGSAINYIDYNAFQTLSTLLEALRMQGIELHLAEFKNPVLQQLKSTPLLAQLPPGRVFFTASEALRELGQV
jgi:SulP family sulfate permease